MRLRKSPSASIVLLFLVSSEEMKKTSAGLFTLFLIGVCRSFQAAWVFMPCLVDEGKAVDVVYLDFSKACDTVPHSILLERLAAHGLDGCMLRWVKN